MDACILPLNSNKGSVHRRITGCEAYCGNPTNETHILLIPEIKICLYNLYMDKNDLISRYNYDNFIPVNFEPWMQFENSPAVGEPAPDFPLWDLTENETSLSEIWAQNAYTIVEFGSFT